MPDSLCSICQAHMARAGATEAIIVRWLMNKDPATRAVAATLTEEQLLNRLDPRVQPYQDAATELLIQLTYAGPRLPQPKKEPPF